MEQGLDPNPLAVYLSRFEPLKALPWAGKIPSEEEAIRWLVDEGYRSAKVMIRTHLIMDKYRFVTIARIMELHGYQMVWYKHRNTVGATRKDAQGAPPTILEATNGNK